MKESLVTVKNFKFLSSSSPFSQKSQVKGESFYNPLPLFVFFL